MVRDGGMHPERCTALRFRGPKIVKSLVAEIYVRRVGGEGNLLRRQTAGGTFQNNLENNKWQT